MAAALGSNLGTWMQRTAQDWLVLTRLTAHNALALGVVTPLRFAPQVLLLPFTGRAADHCDRRRLLALTQRLMAVLALTGVLIGSLGTGLVFLINAASFGMVLRVLRARPHIAARKPACPGRAGGAFTEVLSLMARRPDLGGAWWMFGLMGAVGVNLPILISTMAVRVFHPGAVSYRLIASLMAFGAIGGALFVAVRAPRLMTLTLAAAACAAATPLAPALGVFALAFLILGFALQVFVTSANSLLQLSVEPAICGRLLALLIAVALRRRPGHGPAFRRGRRWLRATRRARKYRRLGGHGLVYGLARRARGDRRTRPHPGGGRGGSRPDRWRGIPGMGPPRIDVRAAVRPYHRGIEN